MLQSLKKRAYFLVAAYFGFWAGIVLKRWKPRIIVVTGSSGKTTTLHLIEAQLGERAVYSHHANSAIGLPFFILGMPPNVESRSHWPLAFLRAPLRIFRRVPKQKLFVAEADTDRPNEGKFLSHLLKPEVTLWISVYNTHALNFDCLVNTERFPEVIDAIAYEFGYFLARAQKLALLNGDQVKMLEQKKRVVYKPKIQEFSDDSLKRFVLQDAITEYSFNDGIVTLPGLHPRELEVSLQMVKALVEYLQMPFDPHFKNFELPPGRSSVFKGVKNTTIIDSTYNTGGEAMAAIISLFKVYESSVKWMVIGDILEQGKREEDAHERLAENIAKVKPARVVLLGPRTKKSTLPALTKLLPKTPIVSFESPKDVLDYLQSELKGGETLLFKGGRFLEGVIEQLLLDPKDAEHLVRRDALWTARRQKWGLPR